MVKIIDIKTADFIRQLLVEHQFTVNGGAESDEHAYNSFILDILRCMQEALDKRDSKEHGK